MAELQRRDFLKGSAALLGGAWSASTVAAETVAAESDQTAPQVRFCLNTSTLMGQKLPLDELVTLAADAGYDGIEPWIREIEAYRESGKSLTDLRKRIEDAGLQVESAIGFATWICDDESKRREGFEQIKRDMELVREIGGTRIAAPPFGQHHSEADKLHLLAVAERYHAILEIGRQQGVVPQVEVWGHSSNVSRLGEAVLIAVESNHPDACLLPDVYHIYRGGSGFEGLGLLSGAAIHCFHFNDYPSDPPFSQLTDADRVYPGDGAAPWDRIIPLLRKINFRGAVSLELFNRNYWAQDPRLVAKTGLEKMKRLFSTNT